MNRSAHRVTASFFLPSWLEAGGLPIVLANDLRAVLPAWLMGMILVCAGFLPFGDSFGVLGYMVGCAAIGAVLAGCDFANRTLSFALSQPVERRQIWRRRMNVAICASIPIALIAVMQPRTVAFIAPSGEIGWMRLLIFCAPLLTGLCVAPWVTLLTRNVLAGAVFSVPLPFAIAFLSEQAANLRFGPDASLAPAYQQFRASFGALMLLAVSAAGALACLRKFLTLEAIEPRGAFPIWVNRTPAVSEIQERRGSPAPGWWQLCRKEMRLQWLALVPALGLAATLLAWQFREGVSETLPLLAGFWAFFTCILIGATGSAEERQLGIVQAQALLPVARWKQWTIKVGALLVVACLLVLILPAMVLHFGPWSYGAAPLSRAALWNLPAVLVLTLAALYFSSLAPTSMQAILLSLPACGILLLAMPSAALWRTGTLPMEIVQNQMGWLDAARYFAMVGGVLVLGTAARWNHFHLELRPSTVVKQLLLAAAVVLFVAVGTVLVEPDPHTPSAGKKRALSKNRPVAEIDSLSLVNPRSASATDRLEMPLVFRMPCGRGGRRKRSRRRQS